MKNFRVIYGILLTVLLFSLIYSCKKDAVKTAPVVSITSVSNITTTSASSGGLITSTGGAALTAAGVCWSTNQNPTTADSKTNDGVGTTSFSSSLSGLTQGTTYYIRAYATNSVGTSYSTQLTFATLALAPTVTTADLSAITSTTATCGGNVTNDGGSPITARGICWGSGQNPTTADSKTTDGTGSGTFTSSMTGLIPGATYYVRAYGTNSIGTSYGSQKTLQTAAILSTVTTTAITVGTGTSATGGGNVTSDGGGAITARGLCWSTTENPTITGSKTSESTGTGSFTSTITGLAIGSTYYIRAYSTNSAGTSYGDQVVLQNFVIGQTYQGGMLAYVLKSGDPGYSASVAHGLIAATSDQSKGIRWSNGSSVTTNATATDLGTGFANTNTIISVQGPVATSYAAGLARAYNGGGYSDWFLPSRDELEALYNNIGAGATGTNKNIGGFANNLYYTSSEFGTGGAYYINFGNGEVGPGLNKSTAIYVRAIRAF